MQTKDEKRQQCISHALRRKDGGDPTSVELMRRWEQLGARLIPLIGEAGLCALYTRTLRLAGEEFAWLSRSDGIRSAEALSRLLGEDLGAADAASARQACARLFDTLTTLLASLIGTELTTRILVSAWGDESNGSDIKEKQQ